MKKIIYTLVLLSFICCTDMGETRFYNYSIVNNSGAEVNIVPYISGVAAPDLKIVLPNGQSINKVRKDQPPYQGQLYMSSLVYPEFPAGINYTQVEFTFNNSKRIIHKFEDRNQPRNIHNIEFNYDRTEIYVITPEDYANAVDCGGNCN